MKSQIHTEIGRVTALITRAETLTDSENETTAERYENVLNALNAALEALEEALSYFD